MKRLFAIALLTTACATTHPPVDPCTLLSANDVQRIEGEAPRETKAAPAEAGALQAQQCFYALPTFAKSFTVTVMTGNHIEHEWEKLFEEREEHEEEDEEESASIEHIPGLGRDARWSVSRYSGVLHVRTSNAIVRITTGSTGDEQDRLRRATEIARTVLAKL